MNTSVDVSASKGGEISGDHLDGSELSTSASSGDERRSSRVACLAIISETNTPLFFKVYKGVAATLALLPDEAYDTQLQHMIYSSLDVVEERMIAPKTSSAKDVDGYLGILSSSGPVALYGLLTNTQQKLIVGLKPQSTEKESQIKLLLKKIHVALVSMFLNPFLRIDGPIVLPSFEKLIDELTRTYL